MLNDNSFGDCCIYIFDTVEFLRRVRKAIEAKCNDGEFAVGIWGPVRYVSYDTYNEDFSLFDKRIDHKSQNEWRIAVASIYSMDNPIVLEIGDIYDIAKKVPRSNLLSEIKNMYPSYNLCTEIVHDEIGLSIYSNRVVTTHFLNSFLQKNGGTRRPPSEIQIVLNNVDNYLLKGNIGGAVKYLEDEFERTCKIEIFEIYIKFLREHSFIDPEKNGHRLLKSALKKTKTTLILRLVICL